MEQFSAFAEREGVDHAIASNNADALRDIFKAHDLVSVDPSWGLEKLESCALTGKSAIMKVLLEELGVKVPFVSGNKGMSPLALACGSCSYYGDADFAGVVLLLIAHGANVNEKNKLGRTLLHYVAFACEPSSVRIASILIQNGVDVDVLSALNETPLSIATGSMVRFGEITKENMFDQFSLVETLLLEGANVFTECHGITCLQNARDVDENPYIIDLLEDVDKKLCERRDATDQAFAGHKLLRHMESEHIDEILERTRKHDTRRIVSAFYARIT
jgi:hypothetical protein